MILHEQRNYLFVHIQKTGGTSITQHLTQHCGARFIAPAHIPLNCLAFSGPKPFIFAAVRNPWERLVSWYEMMLRKGVHNDFSRYLMAPCPSGRSPGFSDFIRRTDIVKETSSSECVWSGGKGLVYNQACGYPKSLAFNQVDYLTDSSGKFLPDLIINFRTLTDGFSEVMQELHPDEEFPDLARLNARPAPGDWRSHYHADDDREWVARLYQRDIDHFGFEFDT